MKKLLFILFIFITACSNNDNPNIEQNKIKASFKLESNTFIVGQDIKITNTSTSDSEIIYYSFNFGNETISSKKDPTTYYSRPGEYFIHLTIKDKNGNTSTISTKVTITMDNSFLTEETNPINTGTFPLEIGIYNNKIFFTERFTTHFSSINDFYRHVEYNEDTKTFTNSVIAQRGVNSGRLKTTFLSNGNKIVTSVESLNYIGLKEIQVNSDWVLQKEVNTNLKTVYGTLQENDQYYFFGSLDNHPAIEIRDIAGKIISTKEYQNEIKNGFIGDLIKNGNTYIAFGGKFEKSSSTFINYKPLVLFFNENLELTGQKTFESTLLNTTVVDWNDLNGSFTIRKLNNGNFALYSHNELRVISPLGEEVKLIKIQKDNSDLNGLIAVEDGFIISKSNFLEKYDNNGNLIKSIEIKGIYTPGFVKKGELIYFASGYQTSYNNLSTLRTYVGVIDSNLNFKK
jgi:hypothetical protein